MNVFILGGASTKFGELWDVSPRALAREAFQKAIKTSAVGVRKIEALFIGNMLSGMLGGQEHLGAFYAEELGISGAAFKIEGACASGGLAFHNAVNAVLSGQYETVAAIGVEKMTDYKPEFTSRALMGAGSDEERNSGITFPGLYAIMARAYMEKYGMTQEELAAVPVKNHYHASLNPNAQFRNIISVEDVMKSAKVADPLKLLECSPISDGASAVIISKSKNKKSNVKVAASVVATDSLGLAQRKNLTEVFSTQEASKKAYRIAGIGAKNVDIAEVHDCFSIAEVLAMEDLGFFEKGKSIKAIIDGQTTLGKSKKLVVNTSGGLKGCGHPVGATGIKQIVEVVDQLTGKAGSRQAKNAKVGLSQNVGGSGATAVVNIFYR